MAAKNVRVFESGFDTYTTVQQIGSGGSGTVFEVRNSEGQRFALKVVSAKNVPTVKLKRFRNEILWCSQPRSKNIVQVLEYGKTNGNSVFYVMPYYPGTLRKLIKNGIDHSEVLPLFTKILDGVEAAHLLGVWHRDIKPENILYDVETKELVLADFGIARFSEDELLTVIETGPNERLANFAYAAPEQRFAGGVVDHRADIYALGLLLNEMYTGQVPQGTGIRQIRDVAPEFAYLDELVELMIRQQPEQRPLSIGKVKEELIGRGNLFVSLQHLEALKKEVVPESELCDPLVADPIRPIEKLDYRNGRLILGLNRSVNPKWEACFFRRATSFGANVSSALISFDRDKAIVLVNEHFLQQGLNFLKQYCEAANEEYASQVKREHQQKIEQKRSQLKRAIAERETKARVLQKIQL
jgi:serine/threonine protein kinase